MNVYSMPHKRLHSDGGAWLKRNPQGNGVEVMPRHRGAIALSYGFKILHCRRGMNQKRVSDFT